MKRFMILGAVWALAVARPETYKEKEDFQFSRSSSDDGTKAGYYGAQRGNMGGNYERAHNMDSLAQNQMSGLVRQVEGELGDGARTKTGSVYTAANSRGTYGSGHLDLGNLAGRNFQEGTSYGDSQSQSSLSAASAYNAAAYANSRSQSSRQSGYQATGHSGLNLQSDNLQALDTQGTQGTGQYEYGRQTSHAAGYNAQSGFQQHAAYDTSNTNLHSGGFGSNIHTRLVSATPVRIIVTPGTRVAIPLAAQSYDITHGSSVLDQNYVNSDTEVLSNDNQRTVHRPSNAKHYESSYNYRKEWEKHDTIPSTGNSPSTSTDNPFPKNSELYEDSQARIASGQYNTRRVDAQRAHSSNIYGGYSANVKSTSGQSLFNYDTQRNGASHTNANAYSETGYGTNHQETSSDTNLNGYNLQSQYNAGRYHGAAADSNSLTQTAHNTGFNAAADLNSQVENLNTKPKSYQSAYSYHKSWERQGDPYVIKPASSGYYDGQSSQRLTTGASQNQGYLATGSHYQHSLQSGADCDENGHIRVARSYNTEDLGQQEQSQNLEEFGQQQSQNLEDFGQQQSQNLEEFGQQQSQNLEDLGQQQQSQNLDDFGQQQSQNLEEFGQQQSQNLEEFGQQQSQNLEDLGQQQQSQNLDNFGQQQQSQNLDDFGQQVQNVGQQTKVLWDPQEAGQQVQNTWDKFEDLGQKPQDINEQLSNVEQNNQNNLGQRTQDIETELKNNPQNQQAQDKWDFGFKSQDNQENINQQSNTFNQQEMLPQLSDDDLQQSQKQNNNDHMRVWDKFDFGSYQNVQQDKFNNEHANSNVDQVSWSSVSQQTGLQQQPQDLVHHNVNNSLSAEQLSGNTQESHKISDTNEQSNTGFFNLNDGHFNLHTNQNQFSKDENSFLETHKLHESSNWYLSNSHRQEQTTNTTSYSHVNAFETVSPNTVALSSLWDKLGNIEQESTLSTVAGNVDKDQGNSFSQVYTNTQNSYGNSMHAHHMESTSHSHLNDQIKPYLNEKDTSQNKSSDTKTEKESSIDVGRGDIGPEDLGDLKPNKFPSDTSVSSETIQNRDEHIVKNNTNTHQDNTHRQDDLNNFGQNENLPEQNFYSHQHHNFQEQKDAENKEQQNFQVFGLHENVEQPESQDSQKEDNLQQQAFQNNGQHDNFEQQNLQHFGQQDNFEQQNVQDIGQQVNLEQQNLQDFDKQDNLEQQNLQDFGQQLNLEQQNLQDFGKQDNLEQQNLQDFGQQENLEQQNVQDFSKQDNFEQQNLHDFRQQENLEQQNLQDFGKKNNLDQQNLQDFRQQVNLEQQNSQDFGQQDEQQFSQDLGQWQHFEQHDFLKQQNSQNVGQHTQDFNKQANLNHPAFGQNENLEQLSLDSEQNFKYTKEQQTSFPKNHIPPQTPQEEIEQVIVKKQSNDLQSVVVQIPSTEVSPTEPVTESSGFWKSVGNKLSRAKSKIASWF